MEFFDELRDMGVDVDDGLDRMMGNAALYHQMLLALTKMIRDFLGDSSGGCSNLTSAIEEVHKIKGAAGNLSVTPLHNAYSEMLKFLRENNPEQAKAVFDKISPVQEEILACIEKHMEA